MSASSSAAVREVTVADNGYLNNWVFSSRNHGLVGTRDVPLLLLDLEEDPDVAGFLASTGTVEEQRMEKNDSYLLVEVAARRRLRFCVRLPVEYGEVVDEIVAQRNVAFADFDTWYSDDDRPRTAVLVTFADE